MHIFYIKKKINIKLGKKIVDKDIKKIHKLIVSSVHSTAIMWSRGIKDPKRRGKRRSRRKRRRKDPGNLSCAEFRRVAIAIS